MLAESHANSIYLAADLFAAAGATQQGQEVGGRRKLGQKVDGCVRMSHNSENEHFLSQETEFNYASRLAGALMIWILIMAER